MNFAIIFESYLQTNNLTIKTFADSAKISESKIKRWARGVSVPAKTEINKLRKLGFPDLDFLEEQRQAKKPEIGKRPSKLRVSGVEIELAPYVSNGPETQADFFESLVAQQVDGLSTLPKNEYLRRLALAASVDGVNTDQYNLESPKVLGKHWNSNYSTHGFHRYVGRFPPHIVRALINIFGLKKNSLILDPFLGSGTTLVEARLMGMKCVGIEICPLSAMISRVKAKFPDNTVQLKQKISDYESFYIEKWNQKNISTLNHKGILSRSGNLIEAFPNVEKWFTPEALFGVSITVEFIDGLSGYAKEFFSCALSSSMRSIGNLDVDVVRAEYSKQPRKNVDVLKLVRSKLNKFTKSIDSTVQKTENIRTHVSDVKVLQGSSLDAKIENGSIDAIITSPPYGVEALSYLRTHLLSYRSLNHILKYDPYSDSEKIVGSEYLPKQTSELWACAKSSKTFETYFKQLLNSNIEAKHIPRAHMMMKFFDDMATSAKLYKYWLKKNGKVAFVIGNKKIGESIVPTDKIVAEIFETAGLRFVQEIKHKLKTNNSNSEVPWQENIIQDEFILMFERV